jgi:hypothetical protein
VLTGIGWLPGRRSTAGGRDESATWKRMPAGSGKLPRALEYLRRWAEQSGLKPSETEYVSTTRDRRQLRFTADGNPAIERLPDARRDRLTQRQSKPPDLVVPRLPRRGTGTRAGRGANAWPTRRPGRAAVIGTGAAG